MSTELPSSTSEVESNVRAIRALRPCRPPWRIEILDVAPFAGGHAFGEVGPYERVLGRLHYAVSPTAPANAAVVDLDRPPTSCS